MPDARDPESHASDDTPDEGLARRRHDGSSAVPSVPASTLMIEIDGFDSIKRARRRTKILDQVSWVIADTLRSTDAVYRHGESGFCAVLANTPEHEAFGAAKRVRADVESMPLLADAGVTVTVTVAAGGDDDLGDTIERAERAMSGTQGSNQVIRANGDSSD